MTNKKETLEPLFENITREMFEDEVYNHQPDYKVILPVNRKTMSDIIAEEILEVQPMSYMPLQTGENYNSERAEFWVAPAYDPGMPWSAMRERNRQINDWCEDTYGPRGVWADPHCRWYASDRKYIFHKKADRTMFVLRWS